MTGDGKAIGQKFGIAFTGRWVWNMKDYIDVGFMKLFYANYLFRDPENLTNPDEKGDTLATEMAPIKARIEKTKAEVAEMDHKVAAKWLLLPEEEEDFVYPLQVIDRMGRDELFMKAVVESFWELKASANQ